MLLRWLPLLPGWDGMHPVLVHFPVALLLVAPLLLVVSVFLRQAWRPWATAALVVMTLGTLSAWLAVGGGHAAGQLADKTLALERAIGRHEALAVTTRNLFTALTLLLGLVLVLPGMLRRALPEVLRVAVLAVFLVLDAAGASWLARTADGGGRLVHESGVRAMVGSPGVPDSVTVAVSASASVPRRVGPRLRQRRPRGVVYRERARRRR